MKGFSDITAVVRKRTGLSMQAAPAPRSVALLVALMLLVAVPGVRAEAAPGGAAGAAANSPSPNVAPQPAPAVTAAPPAGAGHAGPTGPAEGAEGLSDSTAALADSSIAAADSAIVPAAPLAVGDLTFTSRSKIEFTESDKRAETGFALSYLPGDGWAINSNLTVGKKSFRGRDMDVIIESFTNSAAKVDPDLYIFNIMLGETYNKQMSLALSRYGKEIVFNKESAGFNFTLTRPILGSSKSQVYAAAEGSRGKQDFKYNTTAKADAGGHFNYSFGEMVKASAGFGTNFRREESSVSYIVFDWMPSHSDTMKARFSIGKTEEKKLLDASYSRKMGTIREIQPPYGNSMEIIDDPESAYQERNENKGETLKLASSASITDRIRVDLTFNRDYSDERFMIEDRRNKEYESKDMGAGVSYKYHKRGTFTVNLKRAESDTELGPTSIASYRTKDYSLSGSISQTIHDSLYVSVTASTTLKQKIFKKREQNPRDIDYLNSSLDCKLNGHLFNRIKTDIVFSTLKSETVNIDASLSDDNRTNFQYLLSPKLSFDPVPWITLSQKYEMKFDYTEYTFNEDRNYLDRNTTLETDASFRIFRRMKLTLNHGYQMKDTGSYLQKSGGEKLYGRTNENFEHRMRMYCEYNPVKDMILFVRTTYKTQKNNTLGMVDGERQVVGSSGSDSGDLRTGFERSRKLTDSGKIDLDVAYVKKFAPYLSEDRKQYWEVNMNLEMSF